jgi:hypothetical protein
MITARKEKCIVVRVKNLLGLSRMLTPRMEGHSGRTACFYTIEELRSSDWSGRMVMAQIYVSRTFHDKLGYLRY